MNLADLAVNALATYRVTKLVIDDEITRELREKAFQTLDAHPGKVSKKLSYLLTCPWCVGIWAGAGVAALAVVAPQTSRVLNTALASSAITGIMYNKI